MSDALFRVLDWDSQWFGLHIGRADLSVVDASSATEVDRWARAHGLRCVYVFSHTDPRSVEPVAGFELMDVRVEYELAPALLAIEQDVTSLRMKPEEQTGVCTLARQLFSETRFSKDARFPPSRVNELYAEWVRQDSKEVVPGCLVARDNEHIKGFITGRTYLTDLTRGTIGLFGVAAAHRGHGVGASLLGQICRTFIETGVKRVTVITQESNRAACRLYERGGQVVARGYWFHRWYD